MVSLFLSTILSCEQVIGVLNRLQSISLLTPKQKMEIFVELRKSVPSCPVIIKPNDSKTKAGN